MIPLTPAREHYIMAIYTLSNDKNGARVTDIALNLGVSKPSVCTAIRVLKHCIPLKNSSVLILSMLKKGNYMIVY
jgi:hypothetical protein